MEFINSLPLTSAPEVGEARRATKPPDMSVTFKESSVRAVFLWRQHS